MLIIRGAVAMRGKFIIGICDDEHYVHEQIRQLLCLYEQERKIAIQTESFYAGMELINRMPKLHVLLLDIDMPKPDGIETAKRLRQQGINYKIILLTSKRERFKEGFKIGALRFVTKPIDKAELFEAIDEAHKRMLGAAKVSVYIEGRAFEIMQRDILYIMADKAQTNIFTKKQTFRSELSLVQWMELLEPKLFFKTHRKFIVNLSQVQSFEKELITLRSGEKISLSRRQRGDFIDAFMRYDTTYR